MRKRIFWVPNLHGHRRLVDLRQHVHFREGISGEWMIIVLVIKRRFTWWHRCLHRTWSREAQQKLHNLLDRPQHLLKEPKPARRELFLCGRMEFVSEWIYGDLSDWTSLDKVRFNRLIIPSDHNGHKVSRHLDRRVVDVQQPAFLWWIFRGEGDGLRRDAGDLIFFNSPSWAACWTNFCSQGFDPHTWWILPGTKFFHNWDQTSSIWFCDGSIIFYPQMINLGSGSLSWQAHQSRERRS